VLAGPFRAHCWLALWLLGHASVVFEQFVAVLHPEGSYVQVLVSSKGMSALQ